MGRYVGSNTSNEKMKISLVFLCIVSGYDAARILATVFTPSYSHQITFRPLWKELSKRGHHVTLLTTDPMRDPTLPNIREIDLSGSYDVMKEHGASEALTNQTDKLKAIKTYMGALAMTADWQLGHPEVQKIVRNKDEKFDLIITEVAYPTHLGFVDRFKVPFIGVASFDHERSHRKLGNLVHPVAFPEGSFPSVPPLTFKERLFTVLGTVILWWYTEWKIYPSQTATARKHLGEEIRNLEEIEADMSFLFVTLNPALTKVRPIGLNTIVISGMHLREPQPLPKDLKKYMDAAKEGVIYFSLGTNVKTHLLDNNIKTVLLETFAELPYKILWKYEGNNITDLPKNVNIMEWIPQQDLLGHRNVKLFITQCGLQSLEEAVINHVPMVAIPFLSEQKRNAMMLVQKGIGLTVDKNNMTKQALKGAILEVIKNTKFKRNAIALGNLSKDIEKPGLEKAVWWTEYCLRNKGAKHLKSPATDIPLYQYFLLDVLATILAVLLTITITTFLLVKYLIRLLRYIFGIMCRKDTKIKHKKQ